MYHAAAMRPLLTAAVLTLVSACAPPAQPPATQKVAHQGQALVEQTRDYYDLRFEAAADAPVLGVLVRQHQLSIERAEDGVVVDLSSAESRFTGTADVLIPGRWVIGLAGFAPGSGEPLVMHMTVQQAGDELTGSVVVDSDGQSYVASFVAVKSASTPLRATAGAGESAKPAADAAVPTSTHYHLPDGVH